VAYSGLSRVSMGRAVSVIVVTACSCAVGNGTRLARTAPG
jgi:hypothetical protein